MKVREFTRGEHFHWNMILRVCKKSERTLIQPVSLEDHNRKYTNNINHVKKHAQSKKTRQDSLKQMMYQTLPPAVINNSPDLSIARQ
jgi:hypothetical protein